MSNIYYSPENYGLEIVATLNGDLGYEFDMLVVWKTKTGRKKLYWAQDSGCSCPSPFEDYPNIDALNVLTRKTFGELEKATKAVSCVSSQDIDLFLRQVEKELGR
jgi:hypothetical protein